MRSQKTTATSPTHPPTKPPIDGNADDASASDGADNADDETADEPVTDEEALSKSEDSTDAGTAVPVDFPSADADDGETAIIADDDKTTAIADAADVENGWSGCDLRT